MYVNLPIWKCYLYSFIQRWRRYKAINTNQYRWGFNWDEIRLLRSMCSKYLEKGGKNLVKAQRYDQLIDQILGKQMVVADPKEIELANRLLIIKRIDIRRLLMELKELKEYGKEVGLKLAQMNKMDEEELTLEIIRNVEPKVKYSKELVAWYNELPDELFDQAEAKSGATKGSTSENGTTDVSINDVIEVIEGYSKKTELVEIINDEDVKPLFEGFDPDSYKLPTALKKAMIEHLKKPAVKEEKSIETESNDGEFEAIIDLINQCESEDQLVEVFSTYQSIFDDMEVEDDIDEETLQSCMIAHVNSKIPTKKEEREPEKPMTLQERLAAKKKALAEETKEPAVKKTKTESKSDGFDWWNPNAKGFDAEAAFTKAEELKMTELRSFAKHIGLSIGIGKKKDEILNLVAAKMVEITEGVAPSQQEAKTEITAELINDAVKSKDRETLVSMCDQLGITLNAIQKRSIAGMEAKLLETIKTTETSAPEQKKTRGRKPLGTKKDTVETTTPAAEENQSVYSIMEKLVLDGKGEDAIVKAVAPIYKDKGKSILFVKKRVQAMVQIIKIDNGIE